MGGRILSADDAATHRIALRAILGEAGYGLTHVDDGAALMSALKGPEPAPDLVLVSARLPDGDGIALCRRLRADPGAARLPILLIGEAADRTRRLAALRAGADDLLVRPFDSALLLARLRSLLRAYATRAELRRREATARQLGFSEPAPGFARPVQIAVIASTEAEAEPLCRALSTRLSHPVRPLSRDGALKLDAATGGSAPEVFVLPDSLLSSGDGLPLLAELRSRPGTRHAAVLVRYGSSALGATALDLGASDVIGQEADIDELTLRLGRVLTEKRDAERFNDTAESGMKLAVIDPMTGLYNRRYARNHLDTLARRAVLTGQRHAVMVIDVDHFKAINDRHGHPAGDAALQHLAQVIRDNLRGLDLVARLGGEEFLVALPDATPDVAMAAARRLCKAVEAAPARLSGNRCLQMTVSIGVAMATTRPEAPARLLERADRALYDAKNAGRNRATLAPEAGDDGTGRGRRGGGPSFGGHRAARIST